MDADSLADRTFALAPGFICKRAAVHLGPILPSIKEFVVFVKGPKEGF